MSSNGFDPDVWIQFGPLREVRFTSLEIDTLDILTYQPNILIDHFGGSERYVRVIKLREFSTYSTPYPISSFENGNANASL